MMDLTSKSMEISVAGFEVLSKDIGLKVDRLPSKIRVILITYR
jgi:hypothetical protein